MPRSIPLFEPCNLAVLDEPGPGGACHHYRVQFGGPDEALEVRFQRGPRGEPGSTPGVFGDALLAIMEDRLAAFQAGPFACEENARALDHVRAARAALAERTAKRQAAGVLGVNKSH